MGYRVRHVADLASKGGHPGGEERSTLPWPSPGSCGDDPVGSAPRSNRLSGTSPARPCWRSHASGLWRPATIGVTPPAGPAEMQWTSPWRLGTARRRRSVASLGGWMICVPTGRRIAGKTMQKGVDWVQKPAQKCAKRTLARTNTVGCWPWNPTRRKLSSINPSGPHRKAPRLASSHSAIVFREASERTVSSLSPASWECLSGGKERKRRSLIVTGWQPQYNRVRPHAGLAGMLRERQDSYTLEHTFTRLGL